MGDEAKNVLELLSGMHDRTAAVKSLHSLWEVRTVLCQLPQHVQLCVMSGVERMWLQGGLIALS